MYDVIIIGSGCAGYTAAIYTSRALLKTLLIAGVPGGQLATTSEVENFPGFPEGVGGFQLLQNMKTQAERFETEVILDTVVALRVAGDGLRVQEGDTSKKNPKIFTIKTANGEYQSRSVIIATGATAKKLGIPSEETYRGKGISYCATCDGFFFRGKNIVVLGGGDTAMEEATFLSKFANSVTIIHRREEFRASAIMIEKAKKDPKISFRLNTTVEEFLGKETIQTIRLKDSKTGKIEEFVTEGVFVAIGHTPATEFVKGFVEMDEGGYIKTDKTIRPVSLEDSKTATSVEGVFAAGDCVDSRYRQGIVAAGQGAMAAIDVEKWLGSH